MIRANKKPYLTTGEIGKILHITRVTVYRWIKLGQLKAVRVHQGKYRVSKNDFAKFVKQHGLHNQVTPGHITPSTVKILIVDDDPELIGTIKTYLEIANHHYYIAGATNAFEAGQLTVSFSPDVVILNLSMPGVDGFSICRKIKSASPSPGTKIIAVIPFSSVANVKKGRKKGADMVLTKPLDYRKLLSIIKKLTT